MQLSAETGVNRKFILVQVEETIDDNSEAKKQDIIQFAKLVKKESEEHLKKSRNKILIPILMEGLEFLK